MAALEWVMTDDNIGYNQVYDDNNPTGFRVILKEAVKDELEDE